MIFIKLINKVCNDVEEFDTDKFIHASHNIYGNTKLDDFLVYWAMFLYKYPIEESKFSPIFFKQKDLSSKIGVVSRHLIKVAKELEVDQYLINDYCSLKRKIKWWDEYYRSFDSRYSKDVKDYFINGKLDIGKFSDYIERYTYIDTKKIHHRNRFNKVTFKLIEEVLGK